MASESSIAKKRCSLLLLPWTSLENSNSSFRDAYGLSLVKTLSGLEHGHILDIAIEMRKSHVTIAERPSIVTLLRLFGAIYRLIAITCAEHEVDLHGQTSIDIRVLATYNDDSSAQNKVDVGQAVQEAASLSMSRQGPVVPLTELGLHPQPWEAVFALNGEISERYETLCSTKRKTAGYQEFEFCPLAYGSFRKDATDDSSKQNERVSEKYHASVAVGGTFDHLHLGHRLLLTAVALLPAMRQESHTRKCLTIGITGDEMLKNKKFHQVLEPWDQRQAAVARFLNAIANYGEPFEKVQSHEISKEEPNGHAVLYGFQNNTEVRCVEISDPFGPTITDESISALVLSGETRSGGNAVNEKRQTLGWAPLELFEIDVLDAGDANRAVAGAAEFQNKLSSTAIREQLARATP